MSAAQPLMDELAEELIALRRDLHEHPELSLQEVETTRKIRAFLQAHGIELVECGLATGAIAVVRGRHSGPCVAVRADIDALPIHEQTGLAFASATPGKMHACGHDFHTSAGLGAAVLAKAAADSESSFAGTILFVYQPAEELGVGAQLVMDTGVLRDYGVKAIIGEHNNPLVERGKIGVKAGPLMGSVDEFRITVHGVGGHAAIPELAVDPILVGAQMVTGLQHVVSRTVSPHYNVVVTVGTFHAGTARNIIPPEAVLEGTVRCLQPEARAIVEERLRAFAEETAKAYGAQADVEYFHVLPGVVNDAATAEVVRAAAESVVGSDRVVEADPTLGGEDFALYQQHLPGCFFWVGTGTRFGWHHPQFDVDESLIRTSSEIFVAAALRWLDENRSG